MRKFKFIWLGGTTEIGEGTDVAKSRLREVIEGQKMTSLISTPEVVAWVIKLLTIQCFASAVGF